MKLLNLGIVAAALAASSPFACAHFDAIPYLAGDKVGFNGIDDQTGATASNLRVFGYDFGETSGDPYNIGDPGFNTQGASSFASGSTLRVVGIGTLQFWDGNGQPAFVSAQADVTLTLAGSPTRGMTFSDSGITYTPSGATSLTIGTFASNGALHVHLTSSIFSDGDQIDGTVATGVYALELYAMTSTGQMSDPVWFVFNNGLTEEQHDAAMGYLESTLVPEPAALAMLGLGLPALLTRRKEKRGALS